MESSVTMVSGLSNKTYSPELFSIAKLLPLEKPKLCLLLIKETLGNEELNIVLSHHLNDYLQQKPLHLCWIKLSLEHLNTALNSALHYNLR